MSKLDKSVEDWDIDRLKPYEKNAKIHTKEQIKKIATSILKHGLVNPPHVEPDGTIITGHGRTLAINELGWKQIPVVVRYDLSKAEAAALRIADNKVAEGETDTNMLHEELRWLEKELDDDLTILGFDDKELAFLTADLGELDDDYLIGSLGDLSEPDPSTEDSHDTSHEIDEVDKATTSIDKVLGFKNLTSAESRKLKRFLAVVTEKSESGDTKEALFEHIDEVMLNA